jgi:hypothetical protein
MNNRKLAQLACHLVHLEHARQFFEQLYMYLEADTLENLCEKIEDMVQVEENKP